MWQFTRLAGGANPQQQSLEHVPPNSSADFRGSIGLPLARVDDNRLDQADETGHEWSPTKRVLVFALQVALAAAACAGTILAIFAWTGASL